MNMQEVHGLANLWAKYNLRKQVTMVIDMEGDLLQIALEITIGGRTYSAGGFIPLDQATYQDIRLNLDVMNNDIQEQVVQQIMGPMDWQSAVTP